MAAQTQPNISLAEEMAQLAHDARAQCRVLSRSATGVRNAALDFAADAMRQRAEEIMAGNAADLDRGREKNLSAPLMDRLELTPQRLSGMIDGVRQVAGLPDPIGQITDMSSRPSGIRVGRMRVPLGVIAIIYESRPNVTADASALCIKSGNATVLRGGSEAFNTNIAIVECIREGLERAELPRDALQFVYTTDRRAVLELVAHKEYIDVIIPRGGKELIETVSAHSSIPVIKHLHGVCHVYVDDDADMAKAVPVVMNAKTHRYGVCNAIETLLVAKGVADKFFAEIVELLLSEGVELRGCAKTQLADSRIVAATEDDWYEEYLAPILAVRVVDGLDGAIDHIQKYGSAHTDGIVTESYSNAQRFLREVDSSSVIVNASTRFADGFEYGLGAEIGISTNKLHARGPVGLEGLTTQKYVVYGDGEIRR